MTDLLIFQRNFSSHIFKKSDEKILQEISYSKQESLARLNIYRNNVLGSFESVLSDVFRVTKKIVGKKKFIELVKNYCSKFPSKSGNLNDFGEDFPKFLKRLKPLYLKDLSHLELLQHQAYLRKKSTPKFDIKKFKKLQPEEFFHLAFEINSSCALFSSKFAVFSIWNKKRVVKNLLKSELLLISADRVLLLSEAEFLFLSLIQKQQNLYKIYKSLCKKMKKEVDIGKLINRFIESGVIIGFKGASKN